MASWSKITEPVFYILETPGGIDRMAEEMPTDRYEPIFSESLRVARQSRPVPFLDTLWWTNIAMENHHATNGKIHYKFINGHFQLLC